MKDKIREYLLIGASGTAIGLVEAFSTVRVQMLFDLIGVAGLLVMAAFEVGRMVGRANSGCVVYRLDSPEA